LKQRLQAHWGFIVFLLLTLPSFVRVWTTAGGGHFEIFSEGARQLWNGTNPYDNEWMSGKWIYSPPTGYFFFSIFAYLKPQIGALLYMLASYALLIVGGQYFVRELRLAAREQSLFWILIANEAIGSILNTRLEVWIVGSSMLSSALIMRSSRTFLSAMLMAIPTVFKIQTLASAGLMALHFITTRTKRLWLVGFAFVSLVMVASPIAVRGLSGAIQDYRDWRSTLGPHLEGTYQDFPHFYRFLAQVFHLPLTLAEVQALGLVVAAIFAIVVFVSHRFNTARESLLLCLALGSTFATSFSPMSQSAAYILWAPLLAIALRPQSRNWAIIGIAWILVSGLSSDFVPPHVKSQFTPLALKSLGPILLGVWVVYSTFLESYRFKMRLKARS
jgi:hypothetical protein